jgi:hypothetical protein
MNGNNILEIRNSRQKNKRDFWAMFIVFTAIAILLMAMNFITVDVLLTILGIIIISFGITFLISRARKDELMTLDAQGIKVKNCETSWADTKSCYFDYFGKNSMALIFELKDGQTIYYPMGWMRYSKYEVAKYVNNLSGRELFDYSTTAKNIAGQHSWAFSCLFVLLSSVIVVIAKPHYVATTTALVFAAVEFAIVYFMSKKLMREYIEYKFEKALGKAVF